MSTVILSQTSPSSEAETQFQERMKDRMRQAMGDLMPDEVLKEIVRKGVEEAFFAEKVVATGYNSWDKKTEPAWCVTFLKDECRKMVEAAVSKWFVENQKKIEELMEETFKTGLASAVVGAFNTLWSKPMNELSMNVANVFSQLRNKDVVS